MKRVFIGHRGVGKTELLKRHQSYFPDIQHFDLDQVIVDGEKQSVSDIFTIHGEAYFRDLEKKYFNQVIQNDNFVLSLGAGFNTDLIPTDLEVVYVSRRTDSDGRLFLNRPRLNAELSPLQEYHRRYNERESKYRQKANWIYHLSEGVDSTDEIERTIFQKNFKTKNAYWTLNKESELLLFPQCSNGIELRTDLFDLETILKIIKKYPEDHFLVSIRNQRDENHDLFKYLKDVSHVELDTDIEFSQFLEISDIISTHSSDFELGFKQTQDIQRKHIKFCPIVASFEELKKGYLWQQEDPVQRSFLPRTDFSQNKKSLWRWYRQLQMKNQKINFIQSHADMDDQLSLYEYLKSQNHDLKTFGAVLGNPIHHSRTPIEQSRNLDQKVYLVAVPLTENNFDQGFQFLKQMGLKCAAITAPLKTVAAKSVHSNLSAVNSIVQSAELWLSESTDDEGLKKLIESTEINSETKGIAIWGGQGVLESIQKVIPQAVAYSARDGKVKSNNQTHASPPNIVIWAAPRYDTLNWPPADWLPKLIIDLNYTADSLGLEYAGQQPKAVYKSGLEMFRAQAKKQADFWKKYLDNK